MEIGMERERGVVEENWGMGKNGAGIGEIRKDVWENGKN
jgi:hypothetical protein